MGDSYYPAAYGGGQLDFSGITQAAKGIAGGLTDMWDRQAVQGAIESATGPGGEVDYNKAFGNLLAAGRTKEAQVIANYAESQTMNQYRQESLKPDAQRLYEWAYGPGQSAPNATGVPGVAPAAPSGAEPMQLGPDGQPSPQDFLSAQTATKDPRVRARETALGKNDAYMQTKIQAADKIAAGINHLKSLVGGYDDASVENALGPLQGAQPDGLLDKSLLMAPKLGGEVANWWSGGKTVPTEVRSQISGGTLALAAAVKPLIRAPGEGIWTDKDQALLNEVVGDLTGARDKGEFNRRLQGVAERLNANFGLNIKVEDLPAAGGKSQDRLSAEPSDDWRAAPANAQAAPAGVQAGTINGEPALTGPGAAPPLPSPEHKSKLVAAFKRFQGNPEEMARAVEAFDRIYGYPGLANSIIYELQAGR
jgi:hypothetical protein